MSEGTRHRGDGTRDPAVGLAETAAEADEWALVMFSVGIPCRVVRVPQGFALQVNRGNVERAEAELRAYFDENTELATAEADQPHQVEFPGVLPTIAASSVSLAMLGFYGVTGPSRPGVVWFSAGRAQAALIQAGELWRTVTALTLHSDVAHLAGNMLFGTFFLAVIGRSLGPGLALGLVLLAGVGGNLANAFLRNPDHSAIGASTAVFGAIGVMCGLGVVRRVKRGDRWRLVFLPFAAGLGLLAMLGTGGGRVDVFAHVFGLVAGVVLGFGAGRAIPIPPGGWAQLGFAAASCGVLLASWQVALR